MTQCFINTFVRSTENKKWELFTKDSIKENLHNTTPWGNQIATKYSTSA